MGMACLKCRKFMRIVKNGVPVEEGMPLNGAKGDAQYETWTAYKLYMADLYRCPGCGFELLVTGAGQGAIAEHYQNDYADRVKLYPPIARIDDCGGAKF